MSEQQHAPKPPPPKKRRRSIVPEQLPESEETAPPRRPRRYIKQGWTEGKHPETGEPRWCHADGITFSDEFPEQGDWRNVCAMQVYSKVTPPKVVHRTEKPCSIQETLGPSHPFTLDAALKAVVGPYVGTDPMAWCEITRGIWEYIEEHDGISGTKNMIVCDDKLKAIFGVKRVPTDEMDNTIRTQLILRTKAVKEPAPDIDSRQARSQAPSRSPSQPSPQEPAPAPPQPAASSEKKASSRGLSKSSKKKRKRKRIQLDIAPSGSEHEEQAQAKVPRTSEAQTSPTKGRTISKSRKQVHTKKKVRKKQQCSVCGAKTHNKRTCAHKDKPAPAPRPPSTKPLPEQPYPDRSPYSSPPRQRRPSLRKAPRPSQAGSPPKPNKRSVDREGHKYPAPKRRLSPPKSDPSLAPIPRRVAKDPLPDTQRIEEPLPATQEFDLQPEDGDIEYPDTSEKDGDKDWTSLESVRGANPEEQDSALPGVFESSQEAHTAELKKRPLRYKTEMCKFWHSIKGCPNGDKCTWAHSQQEQTYYMKETAKVASQSGKHKLDLVPSKKNAIRILFQFSQRNKAKAPAPPAFSYTYQGDPPAGTNTVTCTIRVNGVDTMAKATCSKKKDAKRQAALDVCRKLGEQVLEAE